MPGGFQMRRTRIVSFCFLSLCFGLVEIVRAQTQTFIVAGETGRKWVNTKIDVSPGTLISIGADGEVFYGDQIGVFGPEGTTKFGNALGFPAETEYRYGLTARVTASASNPEDDLRE